ncbi:MAG: flagellar biosynthesis anti-sigma factor FlgM, partial [Gammaproteobacteria bacterium]|nr:flagellar biosynthesis anti-sigma factor FlgM [Gammaproteobacteria bacterium]
KEMLQAVQGFADDETFDRKKVEQIRREIAEGRFVIDEDRVARKFRELEEQLGDLG